MSLGDLRFGAKARPNGSVKLEYRITESMDALEFKISESDDAVEFRPKLRS